MLAGDQNKALRKLGNKFVWCRYNKAGLADVFLYIQLTFWFRLKTISTFDGPDGHDL